MRKIIIVLSVLFMFLILSCGNDSAPITPAQPVAPQATLKSVDIAVTNGDKLCLKESEYPEGTPMVLTATPDKDHCFVKWLGDECNDSTNIVCKFNMPQNDICIRASMSFCHK